MLRSIPLLLLFVLACSGRPVRHLRVAEETTPPPNLLVLLPDQWRGSALGFLGEEPVHTPHLDRFAAQSRVLTQAASNYPLCSPYRAMFMTGKYPFANGVLGNCNSKGTPLGYELGQDERCWSDVLHDAGYSLGYIGKWHLEAPRPPYVRSFNNTEELAWNEWTPPARRHGFDFWHAYNTYDRHLAPQYWTTDAPRDERLRVRRWSPEHEADQAIRFLANEGGELRDPDAPFALVVAMNPPHTPYDQVPEAYLRPYAERSLEELLAPHGSLQPADTEAGRYTRRHLRHQYAMMTGVDHQVGRILEALRELELEANTVVLFTSDHGDCLGLHGAIAKNQPFEPSMRVPLILRWPNHVPAGRDDLLLSTPDLYPTLLGLLGMADQVPASVQGSDHSALLLGGDGPRPRSQLYLRVPAGQPEHGWRGVRSADHTLVVQRDAGQPERVLLFDNRADPDQLHNLAAEQAELVRRLRREELEPWLVRTGDPWAAR